MEGCVAGLEPSLLGDSEAHSSVQTLPQSKGYYCDHLGTCPMPSLQTQSLRFTRSGREPEWIVIKSLQVGLVISHTAHRCIHFMQNISRHTRSQRSLKESGGQHSTHAANGWPFRNCLPWEDSLFRACKTPQTEASEIREEIKP